jgi:hypothetical protein
MYYINHLPPPKNYVQTCSCTIMDSLDPSLRKLSILLISADMGANQRNQESERDTQEFLASRPAVTA